MRVFTHLREQSADRRGSRERIAGIWGAADQQQKQRPEGDAGESSEGGGEAGTKKLAKKGQELKDEMDALIDEIDEVLEENAEEFVKNYVQRGGE
jgi:ubiquitin-like protein Pup